MSFKNILSKLRCKDTKKKWNFLYLCEKVFHFFVKLYY